MVYEVTDLEKVPDGHSAVRKTMNKNCFQKTLYIVHSPAGTGNAVSDVGYSGTWPT